MNENSRTRKWNIVVNQGAECYEDFEEKIKAITSSNDFWAYILHDKDTNEVGELKVAHIHAVIEFKNARTFKSMQNHFKGAHITQVLNWLGSIQYLVHLNNKEKYQYSPNEIKTSNVERLGASFNQAALETFDPNNIITYYYEGCKDFLAYYKRFGAQIQGYMNLIREITKELNIVNHNMKLEAIEGQEDLPF